MLRICRSCRLLILGIFSVVLVSYILFDLLDIDGSTLRFPSAINSIAEERLVGEGERIHLALTSFPAMLAPLESPPDLKGRSALVWPSSCQPPHFLVRHPRIPTQAVSPQDRDSDPA